MKKIMILISALVFGALASMAAEHPTYPGGDNALREYLVKNVKYPSSARENGVEGIVSVGFIVMTDGTLSDLKILKYVDPDLEKEALRVVGMMPAWIPAEKNGVPEEAPSMVEIPFILDE